MRRADVQHRESRATNACLTESTVTAVSSHSLRSCTHLRLRDGRNSQAVIEMCELLDMNLGLELYVHVDRPIVEASYDKAQSGVMDPPPPSSSDPEPNHTPGCKLRQGCGSRFGTGYPPARPRLKERRRTSNLFSQAARCSSSLSRFKVNQGDTEDTDTLESEGERFVISEAGCCGFIPSRWTTMRSASRRGMS